MQNYLQNGQIVYNKGNNGQQPAAYNAAPSVQGQNPPPSYAGVNIQIFNPMVNPAGCIYPQQTGSAYSAGTQGGCYPATYYTTQPGMSGYNNGTPIQTVPGYYGNNPNGQNLNNQTGFYDQFGKYHPYVQNQNGQLGYIDDNGNFQPLPNSNQNSSGVKDANGQSGFYDQNGKYHQYAKGPNGELGYYDEQGQFHPVDPNNPPSNNGSVKDANGQSGFYDQNGKYHQYAKGPNGELGYYDEQGQFHPVDPNNPPTNGIKDTNGQSGFYDQNGKYHQYAKGPNGELGYYDEQGQFHPVDPNNPPTNGVKDTNGQSGFYDQNGKYHQYAKGPNGELGYYDEQGQFHPVDPNNPAGTANSKETEKNTENVTNREKASEQSSSDGEKTEKKKVVMLSNDYIKSIENYLNSQDAEVRKMGAHEVVDRLAEDSSRNDDPALTALVNKMLQDPSASIRALALSLVDSRAILGDNLTEKILKDMQKSDSALGLDANQATSALLKMAQKTVEKEVPVTEHKQTSTQKTSRPKMPYFFNNDKEKYQWLMKNGCNSDSERKWVEDYIKSQNKSEKKETK